MSKCPSCEAIVQPPAPPRRNRFAVVGTGTETPRPTGFKGEDGTPAEGAPPPPFERKSSSRFLPKRLDVHMREIVQGTALAFALRAAGAGLAFGFNIAVARLVGPEGAGVYFLALSVTAIGSVIGRLGLDNTLLRFVATHATEGDWKKVKGVHALGVRLAIAASGTLSLLGFAIAPWVAESVFHKQALAEPLRWMSLSILPFALLNLQAESLKGLKCIRDALLIQGLGVPLIGLIAIWPLARVAGVTGTAWAYLAATTVIALIGFWFWRRASAAHSADNAEFPIKVLWDSCRPLFISSLVNRAVLPWAPLFVLGIWATSAQVGVFGAATRVAMLMSFALVTANNVLAPKFAELYTKGEIEALGRTARHAALMITVLASPVFFLLTFRARQVMATFGPGFEQGALVLVILAAGQLVNTLTGSVNYFLIVTGNEIVVRNVALMAAVLQIGLCLALVPRTGPIGAAVAAATATAALNLTATYMVWKRLGVVTIPFLGNLS